MRRLFFGLIIACAAYSYWGQNYHMHDLLVYAQKHPKAGWSAAAEYYIGFIYYQRSEFAQASEAFSALVKDHPKDSHVPRALFLLADSAESRRDWDQAKDNLARYIEDFPEGKDIEMAKRRLDMLKYNHP